MVAKANEIRQVPKLIVKYMSMTPGLKSDFISACRSGRIPSHIKDIPSRKRLMKDRGRLLPVSTLSLKKLKRKIPQVTMAPTHIFYLPNLSSLSLTLEQKRATSITESMLHDFTMTTAGKEAACTALL